MQIDFFFNEQVALKEITSCRGFVIKLEGSKKLGEKDISEIKAVIEKEVAPILRQESIKTYGMNMDYLGIVLQSYSNGKKYCEETYFNGEKNYWFKDNWMNFRFFANYMRN